MKRAFLAMMLAGCHASTTSPTSIPTVPATLYRFVDHASDAHVAGDLDGGFAKLDYTMASPSPLPDAPDAAFPRAMQVAFGEADVNRLLGTKPTKGVQKNIDLDWASVNGIYEARESLFLPDGVSMRFSIPPMGAAYFAADVGTLASAGLVVERDGATAQHYPATAQKWQSIGFDLPAHDKPMDLVLRQEGTGPLFVGAPIVRVVPKAKMPNVLFVLVDTLRADALPAMPRLVEYAKTGARFTTAITAATWTRPSLISLFGGDLPSRLGHGADEMIPTERERRRFRAVRAPLLPRRFASLGYDTRFIGNNFFLLGFPRIGLDLGIDRVTDVRATVLDTPAIADEAIRALDAPHDAPQFLYLHFDTPHWPYSPPPAALAKVKGMTLKDLDAEKDPDIRRYLGDCAYADAALGDLFDALQKSGHDQDTLVVIVGDHGEILDPAHSYEVEALHLPTLHHHGWTAYDEILRVPLVMVWPGHVVPRSIDTQTSLVDVAPTIAALAGLPTLPENGSPTAGRSLADALTHAGSWTEKPRPAFTEGQDVRALRDAGWLYVERADGRIKTGTARGDLREQLFDVIADPLDHRDRVHDLAASEHLDTMRARFASLAPVLPDFAEPVLHLAVASSVRAHRLEGEIRSTGQVWVRGIERGRAATTKTGVAIDLSSGGTLELVIDPPDAPLELHLREDGTPLDGSRLLLGAQALPLLGEERGDFVAIDSARVSWLDATRAPYLGENGEVVMWRDPVAMPSSKKSELASDSEVATMMQRWGYAQQPNKAH